MEPFVRWIRGELLCDADESEWEWTNMTRLLSGEEGGETKKVMSFVGGCMRLTSTCERSLEYLVRRRRRLIVWLVIRSVGAE